MAVSIAWRIGLGLATLVLLASVGGEGIVAGPILLPLLLLAAFKSGRPGRVIFSVLAGLTAAEITWAAIYAAGGEIPVVVWLVPLLCFLLIATLYFRVSAPSHPSPR